MKLYHVTSERKARRYRETGHIIKPVRGFTTLSGAMVWAIHTGRKVIYEVHGDPAYKLPDHHNLFGDAWWLDQDIVDFKCMRLNRVQRNLVNITI
ncbi:MAG TPA: hypothetical protein ENI61_01090 [Ignavibacteria bacterium]|nr:hypothetical protein [Ignavibacteria bacterium]